DFVVSQATQNTGIGAQPCQFEDCVVQRIARLCDDVAGYDREVGTKLVGYIDYATGFADGEVWAYMEIADLRDADPFKVGVEIRKREIDFVDVVLRALDNGAKGRGGKWSGHSDYANGANQIAAVSGEFRGKFIDAFADRVPVGEENEEGNSSPHSPGGS